MSQDKSDPTTPAVETKPAPEAKPTVEPTVEPKVELPGIDNPREMAFFEHLEELRARLIKCTWVFMIGFGLAYWVSDYIMDYMSRPLFAALPPEKRQLIYTGLFENFMVHL